MEDRASDASGIVSTPLLQQGAHSNGDAMQRKGKTLFARALLGFAALAGASAAHAQQGYKPDTFEHCGGCSVDEMQRKSWQLGDGGHYFVDLDARTLRYFVISGVDSNNKTGRNGPTLVEAPPNPTVRRAYDNLQQMFDADPSFFTLDTITLSSETVGMGPDLNVAGVSLDGFSPYNTGQGQFAQFFEQQWQSFIRDERRLREAHAQLANMMFNVLALLSSAQVELGVGKGPGSVGVSAGLFVAGELKIRICNRGGDCAVVIIDRQGKWRFDGGYSSTGARYPQMNGGSPMTQRFSSGDGATDYLRDLMNGGGRVTQNDINQMDNYSGGWIYITMVYVDGILRSVLITFEDN
jgi:hypothetical protein